MLGTQLLEANTVEVFGFLMSSQLLCMVPFEVWEGMEVYTRDLTRCHQVCEGVYTFDSSVLRLARCCFLAFLRVDIHLFQALWNDLKLPSVVFTF